MAFLGGFNSGFASGAQLGLGIRDRKDRKARQAVLDERYQAGIDRQDARTKVLDERYQDSEDSRINHEAVANDLAYQGLALRQDAANRQKTTFADSQAELKYKLAERESQKRIKDAADLAAIIRDTGDYSLMFQTPKGQEYMQQFGVRDANIINHKGDFFIHAINDKGQSVVFNPASQGFTLGDGEDGIKPMHANGIKAIGAHFMGLQGNEAMTVDAMLAKRHIATKAQIAKEERGIAGKVRVAEAKAKKIPTSLTPSKEEIKAAQRTAKVNGLPSDKAVASFLAGRVKALTKSDVAVEVAWRTAVDEAKTHIVETPGFFSTNKTFNPAAATQPMPTKPTSKGAAAVDAWFAKDAAKATKTKPITKARSIANPVVKKPVLSKKELRNNAIVHGNMMSQYAENIDNGTRSNGWAEMNTVSQRVNRDNGLSPKEKRAVIYYQEHRKWPNGMEPKTGRVN